MIQKNLNNEEVLWTITRDMNPIAQKLADRHYSRKHPGSRKGFVGPGKKLESRTMSGMPVQNNGP